MKPFFYPVILILIFISTSNAEMKTWTSSDGRTIKASYISSADGKVVLKKSSGKSFTLDIQKLSQEDQKFISELSTKETTTEEPETKKIEQGSYDKEHELSKLLTGRHEKVNRHGLDFRFFGKKEFLDTGEKYPLLIFLHGHGYDMMKDIPWPGELFTKHSETRPCFFLSPHSPNSKSGFAGNIQRSIIKMMDEITENLPIDTDRIYLMGYSMGGNGSIQMLDKKPHTFAAAIIVAPAGGSASNLRGAKNTALWFFHGANDKPAPVEVSRKITKSLKKLGRNVKYTEFPDQGHSITGISFSPIENHVWLFNQNRANQPTE